MEVGWNIGGPRSHRRFDHKALQMPTSAMRNMICSSQLWRATSFLRLGVIHLSEAFGLTVQAKTTAKSCIKKDPEESALNPKPLNP